jgi:hypothetical protein
VILEITGRAVVGFVAIPTEEAELAAGRATTLFFGLTKGSATLGRRNRIGGAL